MIGRGLTSGDQAQTADQIDTGNIRKLAVDHKEGRVDAAEPMQSISPLLKTDGLDIGDTPQNLREARKRRILFVDDGYVHRPSPRTGVSELESECEASGPLLATYMTASN